MVESIADIITRVSPYYSKKKSGGEDPYEALHTLTYDSGAEILESVYFFILDLLNDFGLNPDKLIDNFTDTPGGTHFSEVGMKASRMQDEAIKLLGNVNTVLRSVLNIIYDLKEFRIRLEHYDALKGSKEDKEAATLSLKQIWMDKVDISKGNSSIKAMALGQSGYQTLIDAFLVSKNPSDIDKLDLNDRVKRILKPRLQEFNNWVSQSENELRKRFEMEKTYLRSQVNSLKLYSRWVKPYLKAAEQLKMEDRSRSPDLVNMFNTVVFEIVLFGKNKVNIHDASLGGQMPVDFHKLIPKRNYYSCLLVEFTFRGIPTQQRLVGRTTVNFKAYALNDDEIAKLYEEIDNSDIGDVLNLIEGATTESLDQLKDEIESFLKDDEKEKKKYERKDQSNPFLALVGYYNKQSTESKKSDSKNKSNKPKDWVVKKDDWIESTHLRSLAIEGSVDMAFNIFDVYKKAHDMPSWT